MLINESAWIWLGFFFIRVVAVGMLLGLGIYGRLLSLLLALVLYFSYSFSVTA